MNGKARNSNGSAENKPTQGLKLEDGIAFFEDLYQGVVRHTLVDHLHFELVFCPIAEYGYDGVEN